MLVFETEDQQIISAYEQYVNTKKTIEYLETLDFDLLFTYLEENNIIQCNKNNNYRLSEYNDNNFKYWKLLKANNYIFKNYLKPLSDMIKLCRNRYISAYYRDYNYKQDGKKSLLDDLIDHMDDVKHDIIERYRSIEYKAMMERAGNNYYYGK